MATLLGAIVGVALGGVGPAWASASAPYFTALPASGATKLQSARYGVVAVPLPKGQVVIAGGATGSGDLQSAELFNPATGTFTALTTSGSTELHSARDFAVAAESPPPTSERESTRRCALIAHFAVCPGTRA